MKKEKASKKEIPESSIKSFKKMANETGKFYTSCIDALLECKTLSSQQKRLKQLVDSLPKPMQKLYQKGIDSFLEQTRKNQEILSKKRGEKRYVLLKEILKANPTFKIKDFNDFFNKINEIDESAVKYKELSPGIPLIRIKQELYEGLINKQISSMCILLNGLLFIITKNKISKNILKHELSHFIFHFLKKDKYLRQERDKSWNKFSRFRNEIVAYIMQQSFKNINFISERLMDEKEKINTLVIKTKDGKELNRANKTINFLFFSMVVGSKMGVDMNDFIFPCLISRDYNELIKNCNYLVKNELVNEWLRDKNNKGQDILKFCGIK
ncbi:MAG: hypothetical protein PHG49_02395 [Candidatus Pacebacteria bacterium]|nr:hypothetical protein [Candidatus Paceibacterota bacterium]